MQAKLPFAGLLPPKYNSAHAQPSYADEQVIQAPQSQPYLRLHAHSSKLKLN